MTRQTSRVHAKELFPNAMHAHAVHLIPFSIVASSLKWWHVPAGGLDISRNVGAWSSVANMLYLDSPAGVGLSYSGTAEDYTTNDTRTAQDSAVFLHRWFQEYEAFAKLPFYISGAARQACTPGRN